MEDDDLEISLLLHRLRLGDQEAFDILYERVYAELKERAVHIRNDWNGNNTMSATAIVHEAYVKLVHSGAHRLESRAHFMSVAAKAMRQVLINYAEKGSAQKRGGGAPKLSLQELMERPDQLHILTNSHRAIILDLENALSNLEKVEPEWGRIVECRFFSGMTIDETAEALNMSPSKVKRRWKLIQSLLYRELVHDQEPGT